MSVLSWVFGRNDRESLRPLERAWSMTAKRLRPLDFDEPSARPIVRGFFKDCLFTGDRPYYRFDPRAAEDWHVVQPSQAQPPIPSVSKFMFDTIGYDVAHHGVLWRVASTELEGFVLHPQTRGSPFEVESLVPIIHIYQLSQLVALDRAESEWHTGRLLGKVLFETLGPADMRTFLDHHEASQPDAREEFAMFSAAVLLGQKSRVFKRFKNKGVPPDPSFARRWQIAKRVCALYLGKEEETA